MAILVVDDSPPVLKLLEATLLRSGFTEVVCVDSGLKALNLLGLGGAEAAPPSRNFDLVLLDIIMPDINGLDVCRRIKASQTQRDLPIIMVTVQDEAEVLKEAFDAGASDYIVKPVRELELLTRVNAVLRLQQEMRRRRAREVELFELAGQLEAANRLLEQLSVTDELTRVGNRRSFMRNLQQEWGRCLRESWPLTVIFVEVDCFREYLENFSHKKADECLKLVANVLKVALKRSGDFLARFDGERFAIFLPKTDEAGARVVADAMRLSVEGLEIRHPASTVGPWVTVSTGVGCQVPTIRTTCEDLIAKADADMANQRRIPRPGSQKPAEPSPSI